jgi:hypothetical protein
MQTLSAGVKPTVAGSDPERAARRGEIVRARPDGAKVAVIAVGVALAALEHCD